MVPFLKYAGCSCSGNICALDIIDNWDALNFWNSFSQELNRLLGEVKVLIQNF